MSMDERGNRQVTMRMVVGLGNPGTEYAHTRHNVGFEVIDRLARRHGIAVRRRTLRAVVGDGLIEAQKVLLAKPMTYMNLSGEAVGALARMYRLPAPDVIVVVDDIALPLGKLRLRMKGSAGGHNGLESIERGLRTQEYPRIRIGVGAARPGRMVDHVLGRFQGEEREIIAVALDRAADAVEMALREGFEQAMNTYNREPGGD